MINEISIKDLPDLKITLHKPNRDKIGILSEAYGRNIKIKFGNINELTFTIPRRVERLRNQKRKMVDNKNFTKTRERYLLKVQYHTITEWMIITETSKSKGSNGSEEKSITAKSLQFELNDKRIKDYEGESLTPREVMNDALRYTIWSVGTIDVEIASKRRQFEVSESSVLSFLSEIAETFEAVLVFNTEIRQVSLRLLKNVEIDRRLTLTKGKYLKNLTEDLKADEMVTRLKVFGKDGMSINEVNPTGANYVEDFSFFMQGYETNSNGEVIGHSPYMSDELCQAIIDYNELVNSKQGVFTLLLDEQTSVREELLDLYVDLAFLENDLTIIQNNLDIAKATDGDVGNLRIQRDDKIREIDAKNNQIDDVESYLSTIESDIYGLSQEIAIENNFTESLIQERNQFIIEAEWEDRNYFEPQELMDAGKEKLKEMYRPKQDINMSLTQFLASIDGYRDWDKIGVGYVVRVHYKPMGIDFKALISELDIGFDGDMSMGITISNVRNKSYEDMLNKKLQDTMSSSKKLSMESLKWNEAANKTTEMEQIITGEMDATQRRITAGTNESVEISRRGIVISSPQFPNEQIVQTAGVIALSDDYGENWKTAITAQGVMAERLLGRILAGQNLTIENDSGKYTMDEDGFTIDGGSLFIRSGLADDQIKSASKWNAYEGKFDEVNSEFEVVRDEIRGKVSAEYVDGAIADIEIGGRNLLRKENFGSLNNYDNYMWEFHNLGTNQSMSLHYNSRTERYFEPGEYVFSFEMKLGEDYGSSTANIRLSRNYESDSTFQSISYVGSDFNSEWKRVTYQFSLSENANIGLQLYSRSNETVFIRNLQIEKGNKATDWSPAPEDTEQQITTISNQVGEFSVKQDEITQTVSNHTTTIDALTDQVESNIEEVAQIKVQADEISQTVTEVRSDLDGLEIGGRNLIIRSTEEKGTWIDVSGQVVSANNHSTSDYIPVKPNNDYMFTKSDSILANDDGFFGWAWYDEDKNYISRRANSSNEFLWTTPNNVHYVRISYPDDSYPKFEKGNKATDWEQAPEDVQSEINSVYQYASTEINQLSNQISSMVTEKRFNELSGEVDTLSSTVTQTVKSVEVAFEEINGIEGSINNAVTTIDGTGITVKDGSFYLQDDSTDTKYSVTTRTNLIYDHSFELCVPDYNNWNTTYDWADYVPYANRANSWYPAGATAKPKMTSFALSGYQDPDSAIFGEKSMIVNNTSYIFTQISAPANTEITLSAYFQRHRGISAGSPSFVIRRVDELGNTISTIATKQFSQVPNDYSVVRRSFTFTTPNLQFDESVEIYILTSTTNWVKVDGVQAVIGSTPVLYTEEESLYEFLDGRITARWLNTDSITANKNIEAFGSITSNDTIKGSIHHSHHYLRIYPYSSHYEDGSNLKMFYSGKGYSSNQHSRLIINISNANGSARNAYLQAGNFYTSSTEDIKDNIVKWEDSVLDTYRYGMDLYTYNLKEDPSKRLQHGLVIGDGYKTPKELVDGDAISQYDFNTMNAKATKEIIEIVDTHTDDIDLLKLQVGVLQKKLKQLTEKE